MARLTAVVARPCVSLAHRAEALAYAMSFTAAVVPRIADRSVGMWVNEMTLDIGERGPGRAAARPRHAAGVIPRAVRAEFVSGF